MSIQIEPTKVTFDRVADAKRPWIGRIVGTELRLRPGGKGKYSAVKLDWCKVTDQLTADQRVTLVAETAAGAPWRETITRIAKEGNCAYVAEKLAPGLYQLGYNDVVEFFNLPQCQRLTKKQALQLTQQQEHIDAMPPAIGQAVRCMMASGASYADSVNAIPGYSVDV